MKETFFTQSTGMVLNTNKTLRGRLRKSEMS